MEIERCEVGHIGNDHGLCSAQNKVAYRPRINTEPFTELGLGPPLFPQMEDLVPETLIYTLTSHHHVSLFSSPESSVFGVILLPYLA